MKEATLQKLNSYSANTLLEALGIECVDYGDDYLMARMPVDKRTHQPMGLLHGGASMALIESIGSLGSMLHVDRKTQQALGIEINANHIRSVKSGFVRGVGKLVQKGKRLHVWQVDIFDEANDKLVCTGRLTVMITSIN